MKASRLARLEELEGRFLPPAQDFFDVTAHCFPKQLPFVASSAKLRTACCSRRAGKSEGCAALLVDTALKKPGGVGLYLTSTRINAKKILWRPLKKLLREKRIAAVTNESELSVTFANGSMVYLAGAHHQDELEKYRGMPLAIVVIDEAQMLSSYLEGLLDDILVPALMDYDGGLVLAGTPAPTPAGYFWDCIAGKHAGAWEHHAWTAFDNPWIEKKSSKPVQAHLEAELKRRNVTLEDPKIQREWFGRWAFDPSSLVFKYDGTTNDFDSLPEDIPHCVIGVDLGFDDADAISILKWGSHSPLVYLAEESVLPKQTITQLGERLRGLVAAHNPLKVVIDTGGLGKKISEELNTRWKLQVEAADKTRKLEHIELLNDAMRSGHFKAKKASRYAQDCALVEWDKSNPEKWEISERFHSDICDSVLYAYRSCMGFLATPAKEKMPAPRSPEWMALMAKKAEEEIHAELRRAPTRDEELEWL